jgi:fumarate hydratase class I
VAKTLLRNAVTAAKSELPLCQDTGTATIAGWKDESVRTGGGDAESLSEGARLAYGRYHLRSSQVGASSFFDEFDTRTNLPAQVHLEATETAPTGRPTGSFSWPRGADRPTNSSLSNDQGSPGARPLRSVPAGKVAALGVAACPPYRLAVVVGGTSAEENLRILKLATTEILDGTPEDPTDSGGAFFRDAHMEERLMVIARECGAGAQFGGTALALDARVLRLSRHAASCPVSIGVSCSAHRNVLALVDAGGARIEALEERPGHFFASLGIDVDEAAGAGNGRRIDLDRPMAKIRRDLSACSVGARVLLSGRLLVARDAAHLKWHALKRRGRPVLLPSKTPILYAGPAEPRRHHPSQLRPTTPRGWTNRGGADVGGFAVTMAKGNRGAARTRPARPRPDSTRALSAGPVPCSRRRTRLQRNILDNPEQAWRRSLLGVRISPPSCSWTKGSRPIRPWLANKRAGPSQPFPALSQVSIRAGLGRPGGYLRESSGRTPHVLVSTISASVPDAQTVKRATGSSGTGQDWEAMYRLTLTSTPTSSDSRATVSSGFLGLTKKPRQAVEVRAEFRCGPGAPGRRPGDRPCPRGDAGVSACRISAQARESSGASPLGNRSGPPRERGLGAHWRMWSCRRSLSCRRRDRDFARSAGAAGASFHRVNGGIVRHVAQYGRSRRRWDSELGSPKCQEAYLRIEPSCGGDSSRPQIAEGAARTRKGAGRRSEMSLTQMLSLHRFYAAGRRPTRTRTGSRPVLLDPRGKGI